MRRPSSTRISSLFKATACLAGVLTACLSSVTVDLGSNYQERLVEAQAPPPPVIESGLNPPPIDAPDVQDADPPETTADSPPDEEIAPPAPICINNPSFEPLLDLDGGPIGVLADPPYWLACTTNRLNPAPACVLPPTDGASYLGLSIGLAPYLYDPASVDIQLCAPLQPGVTYALKLDFALDAAQGDGSPGGEPPALQVWGGSAPCDTQAVLLARFSGATNNCRWKTLCETFVPQAAYTHLILVPEATSSTDRIYYQTNLLVDNLRYDPACAPP
jgi:hypothetical protein